MQFTAAGLFQCLLVGVINDETRMRLEFIVHNDVMNDETRMRLEFIVPKGHHKLTFESWVGKISARAPNFSHQD
eukprot:scaffold4129_cov82-Cyclotella_meneghiniana.AAC.8